MWLPIPAPFAQTACRFVRAGIFPFDYLMPGELFTAALAGECLLLWGAGRTRLRREWIGWSVGIVFGLYFGFRALILAVASVLGKADPGGWTAVLAALSTIFDLLALVAAGAGGVCLLRDLFWNPRPLPGNS